MVVKYTHDIHRPESGYVHCHFATANDASSRAVDAAGATQFLAREKAEASREKGVGGTVSSIWFGGWGGGRIFRKLSWAYVLRDGISFV